MKKVLWAGGAVALIAALVIGLTQRSSSTSDVGVPEFSLSKTQVAKALSGAPAPLARVHADAGKLLGGGRAAFAARLADLAGYPVVVNKWASWCGPCRLEFPLFQQASVDLGKRVAFLGLNSGDNRGNAAEFLSEYPVSFPSYVDPNEKIALKLGVSAAYPSTIFFNARGEKVFAHQGQYRNAADLMDDIERYALGVQDPS